MTPERLDELDRRWSGHASVWSEDFDELRAALREAWRERDAREAEAGRWMARVEGADWRGMEWKHRAERAEAELARLRPVVEAARALHDAVATSDSACECNQCMERTKDQTIKCLHCGYEGRPDSVECACYDYSCEGGIAAGMGCPHGAFTCPVCDQGEKSGAWIALGEKVNALAAALERAEKEGA